MSSELQIVPLPPEARAAVAGWPPYGPPFEALNYALQAGRGWLDVQGATPGCAVLGGWSGRELVAFSLLVPAEPGAAEFYVAVKAGVIGRGLGRQMTRATLRHGFDRMGLERIFLKVRVNHEVGRHLYAALGFRECGRKQEETNGVKVDFVLMEIGKADRPVAGS